MSLINTIDHWIPFLEIQQDCIISKTGDCTVGFEITKPELFSLAPDDFEKLHLTWVNAIRGLPYHTVIHFQDWYTRERFQAAATEDESYLTRASNRFFHERPFLSHRCYCFLTHKFGSRGAATSALSSLIRPSLAPEFIKQPALLREFLGLCQQFEQMLKGCGLLDIRRLNDNDLGGTRERAGVIEQYCQLTIPANSPVLSDISFKENMTIGDHPCFLYMLADALYLPAQCSAHRPYESFSTDHTRFPIGFATSVGPLLNADHIYNQYIFIEDPVVALRKLEIRRRRLQSLSAQDRENAVACETIGRYLQEAANAQGYPVKAHFNVFVWGEADADIDQLKNKVHLAISRIGAVPRLETEGAPQIWWAGIPGNAGEFPMNDTFDTFVEQAACFLIPETNGRSSISPFGIRLGDRLSGHPLHVNISEAKGLSNRNKFILGGSGSGKSFFTNHLVRCYYEQGAHIVLVDVGGSYKGLCELLGGYYFTYTEKSPLRFNPFWLPTGEILDTEKKENIKTLLVMLWKKSDERFLRSEYVSLSNALQAYYEWLPNQQGVFADFNSFYEFLQGEYVRTLAVQQVREKDFDITNFLYVLRPFYRGGEYDYLLNAHERLDLLYQRFLIFELDNIKDHPILFPVVTIIIMEAFISKMRKLPGIRKMILIEEAWKALAKEGMGEYINYLFRTVRKFFGEAVVVTQEVDDIISSPIVRDTIVNNSDCKILLDQSKFANKFEAIQKLLGLSEKDKTLILSLNKANDPTKRYKEVFIGLGKEHSRVYRTEVSLEEYLTYTTEETEKVKVRTYIQRFGSMRSAISQLATDIRSGLIHLVFAGALTTVFLLAPSHQASAQIIEIIDETVKKILVAADLQVQRLQTQTILLQNVQKNVENAMEQSGLDDIRSWVQRQEDLYANYYQELWLVKTTISSYSKVKTMIARQAELIFDYKKAWKAVQQDPHFNITELARIGQVYESLLEQSARNVQQLVLVISDRATQMDDAGRLRIIDATANRIDQNRDDLRRFTSENTLLSLQRSKDELDLQTIRNLYGIQTIY